MKASKLPLKSCPKLPSSKLPRTSDVLKFFLHHHIDLKKKIKVSATEAANEIIKVWRSVNIPTEITSRLLHKSNPAIKNTFCEKSHRRTTDTQLKNNRLYKAKIGKLFHIAPKNVLLTETDFFNEIVCSPEVASALDRTNTTNNEYMYIAGALATAGKLNLRKCKFSSSTSRRRRINQRSVKYDRIKKQFSTKAPYVLIVHFDGKKMLDTTN